MRLAVRYIVYASLVTASVQFFRAEAQTCSVPASTLTTDCDSLCSINTACARKDSTTTCDVDCYRSRGDTFTFLVPFDATVGDTATTPSKNNSALTKIAKLALPSTTTKIILRGGSNAADYAYTLSKVATVDFADGFLTGNPQLQEVTFDSFDLATSASTVVSKLPSTLTGLWLINNLLTELPSEVASFRGLDTLNAVSNFITKVDESHEIELLRVLRVNKSHLTSFTALFARLTYLDLAFNSLTEVPPVLAKYKMLKTLHLSGNKVSEFKKEFALATLETLGLFSANLSEFDVYLPSLTTLYLDDNNFKEIPPVIFNHSRLHQLYLGTNQPLMVNVTLTNTQANFLATLKNLTIPATAFSIDCDASQQTTVQGYLVCITGGPVDLSIIQGPRVPVRTPLSPSPSAKSNSTGDGNQAVPGSSTSDTSSSNSSSVPVIIGIVAGVLVVVAVVGFAVWKTRSRAAKPWDGTSTTNHGTDYSSETHKSTNGGYTALWNDPDLLAVKVNVDDIEDIQKIGQGAFCDVWLVMYRRSQQLASKRLKDVTRSRTQGFIDEIKLVETLKHPHVVEFVGAAWTKEADLQALFEFMEGGDLRNYLADDRTARAWSLQKVQLAVDIAEGLVYVHSFNPPLVHRDLKSRNVLLSADMQAKLTDFGVSRFHSANNMMTSGVGTGKWLAPEVIAGSADYGTPADMFSFGVVLSELDTNELPYEDVRGANGHEIADVALLQMVASGTLRPRLSPACPPEIATLAAACWSLRPEDRPSAPEAAYALRSYRKSLVGLFV